jgi:hypothetical protein
MEILLTLLSCLLVLVFLAALAYFVVRITRVLESIGTGGTSALAMIAWGVRAIEVETGHIPTQVTQLNAALTQVAGVLRRIDEGLVAVAEAASAQERYRR